MFSLNNYKEQCYNLGSPEPSPSRPPLQAFPKVNHNELLNDFEFPLSPIKIKINTRQSKKKAINDPEQINILKTPTKKPKTMKEEELRAFLTGITQKMDQFSVQLASNTEQSAKTEQNLATLTNSFANLKKKLSKQ